MMAGPASSEAVVTLEQMRARLDALDAADLGPETRDRSGEAVAVSPARRLLRERVALLDYFAVGSLDSGDRGGGPDSAQVQAFVAEDCELVTTRTGSGWRLGLGVRHETLAHLGVRGALDSVTRRDAVPAGADDVTHRMARRLLEGERELSRLSPTELSGILRARDWLAGLGLWLPSETEVKAALDLANVLAPLRAVARADFVGRERELAMLEGYIWSPELSPPPLAIHGPGGIGKSALVAKLVLDHVEGRAEPLTFAYLTFDRAELDPQFPLTLVREAIRQLALQNPVTGTRVAGLLRDLDSQLAADVALRGEASSSRGTGTRDIGRSLGDRDYFNHEFAELVRSVQGGAPILLVLDTFEVAQRRRRSSLSILERALRELSFALPSLRVVVAGRAEAHELTNRQESLGGLTPVQARHLLRTAVHDLDVPDELVDDVARRMSGNPLSLRLAAELMRREGERALASARGRRRFLFGLRAEQVQGILYRRILDHIDPAVRPLANPGLVVRRITPEVIAEVLAEPCGLGSITPEHARALFESLRQEVSLVTEVSPGVLVHRADVRQEMLPLLEADDRERVAQIHHGAVAYYGARTGSDDVTEHLYHRLMLGEPAASLDEHWSPVAGAALETVLPELPPSSRVYLASRLPDVEADPADLLAADQDAWVRQVTRQARRLLDSGQPQQALDLVLARPTPDLHDDPAVSLLLIEALASLRRRDEALEAARAAIGSADAAGQVRDYVELGILAGRVAEDAGQFQLSQDYFTVARETAQDIGARTAALTAGAGVLRLMRRREVRDLESATHRLRGELTVEVATLTERDKTLNPGLLRELAAELGDEVPTLLADAAAHLGVSTIASAAEPPPLSSAVTGRAVADALKRAPDDVDLHETVKQYWQAEADRPSFDYQEDPGS